MVTGCLITIKSCHICIRWLKSNFSYQTICFIRSCYKINLTFETLFYCKKIPGIFCQPINNIKCHSVVCINILKYKLLFKDKKNSSRDQCCVYGPASGCMHILKADQNTFLPFLTHFFFLNINTE